MAYRHVVKNPRLQSRIFLTNWFMKIVRPGRDLDNNVVQFRIPLDMSKIDVKNYLKNIYNVDVAKVNTRIQEGKTKKMQKGSKIVKKKYPDYKVAYVTLAEGTFKFPDMFAKQEEESTKETADQKTPDIRQTEKLQWF